MAQEQILIVDDDPEVLEALGRSLRRANYRTSSAPDAETALREIAASPPAVIVCDILMPGINGFQCCRELKAKPETAGIPVILMSGKTDPADHFWAKEVGARILLKKPVEVARLLSEIQSALAPAP